MEASQPGSPWAAQSAVEEKLVKCSCCGLTEECTPEYIATVKERHQGRWICALCAEAIKDENSRSQRDLSAEEAMKRHASFREEFRLSSPPAKSPDKLISVMKQLLRRTLKSPKKRGWVVTQSFEVEKLLCADRESAGLTEKILIMTGSS